MIVEAETRIKVRVTKIKSGGVANVEKELPTKERQKLEQSVKEGLEKAGLESIGELGFFCYINITLSWLIGVFALPQQIHEAWIVYF